jgi:hypothetical protein
MTSPRNDSPTRALVLGGGGAVGVGWQLGVVVPDGCSSSLDPMDEEAILASVGRTRGAVVVDEAVRRGGLGGEIA